jgi:tetratricopeptide (TPR) repeat protein
MRRLCAISILAALGACSTAHRSRALAPDAAARLADVDRRVAAGCYDCLASAFQDLEALRTISAVAPAATERSIRVAALLAMRERELGMSDTGYLTIARGLLARAPDALRFTPLLDIIELLPGAIVGVGRPPNSDDELQRSMRLRSRREEYESTLRERAPAEPLAAYAWTSYMCGANDPRQSDIDQMFSIVEATASTPLIAFRRATCRGFDRPRLDALMQDPRWMEVNYLLGLAVIGRRDLDGAQALLERAYGWHPAWPALTQALGDVAMTAEDFDAAVRYYDETIKIEPRASAAQLGKVRALTYFGRHEDAIATSDLLVAGRWNLGEARYWRALNEAQLRRDEEAWTDVEEAAKLLINADVPKLAGIVAYRRRQLDLARARFDLSRERNPDDCETGFYLGVVSAEQSDSARAIDVLAATVACLEQAEKRSLAEIASIRASADPDRRKARQVARLERDIASGRRMLGTAREILARLKLD